MAKSHVVKEWTEMSETFLSDGPPKRRDGRYTATLFLNYCEVRRLKKGDILTRRLGIQEFTADGKDELGEQIGGLLKQDHVRLLKAGIDANDFKRLPVEGKVSADVLDGTAKIYQDKNRALYGPDVPAGDPRE